MYVSFHGVKSRIISRVFVGICRKTLGFDRFSRQPTHPTALHQFANHVCPLTVVVASFPIDHARWSVLKLLKPIGHPNAIQISYVRAEGCSIFEGD